MRFFLFFLIVCITSPAIGKSLVTVYPISSHQKQYHRLAENIEKNMNMMFDTLHGIDYRFYTERMNNKQISKIKKCRENARCILNIAKWYDKADFSTIITMKVNRRYVSFYINTYDINGKRLDKQYAKQRKRLPVEDITASLIAGFRKLSNRLPVVARSSKQLQRDAYTFYKEGRYEKSALFFERADDGNTAEVIRKIIIELKEAKRALNRKAYTEAEQLLKNVYEADEKIRQMGSSIYVFRKQRIKEYRSPLPTSDTLDKIQEIHETFNNDFEELDEWKAKEYERVNEWYKKQLSNTSLDEDVFAKKTAKIRESLKMYKKNKIDGIEKIEQEKGAKLAEVDKKMDAVRKEMEIHKEIELKKREKYRSEQLAKMDAEHSQVFMKHERLLEKLTADMNKLSAKHDKDIDKIRIKYDYKHAAVDKNIGSLQKKLYQHDLEIQRTHETFESKERQLTDEHDQMYSQQEQKINTKIDKIEDKFRKKAEELTLAGDAFFKKISDIDSEIDKLKLKLYNTKSNYKDEEERVKAIERNTSDRVIGNLEEKQIRAAEKIEQKYFSRLSSIKAKMKSLASKMYKFRKKYRRYKKNRTYKRIRRNYYKLARKHKKLEKQKRWKLIKNKRYFNKVIAKKKKYFDRIYQKKLARETKSIKREIAGIKRDISRLHKKRKAVAYRKIQNERKLGQRLKLLDKQKFREIKRISNNLKGMDKRFKKHAHKRKILLHKKIKQINKKKLRVQKQIAAIEKQKNILSHKMDKEIKILERSHAKQLLRSKKALAEQSDKSKERIKKRKDQITERYTKAIERNYNRPDPKLIVFENKIKSLEKRKIIIARNIKKKQNREIDRWNIAIKRISRQLEKRKHLYRKLKKQAALKNRKYVRIKKHKKRSVDRQYKHKQKRIVKKIINKTDLKFRNAAKKISVPEYTKITYSVNKLRSTVLAIKGNRLLAQSNLIDARRAFNLSLYLDKRNRVAKRGVGIIKRKAAKLYRNAMRNMTRNRGKSREILTSLINTLLPTNELAVRSFMTLHATND